MKFKKFCLLALFVPVLFSPGCFSDATSDDESRARTALLLFDDAYRSSARDFSRNYYTAINQSVITSIQESEIDFDNPVGDIVELGISGATDEMISELLLLIQGAILNPWSLIDSTSLGGTHGCVTWSISNDLDLQTTPSLVDLFNPGWWTLTVQTAFTQCPEIQGDFMTSISGSRIGIVYEVNVKGSFNVAAFPGEEFAIDLTYSLEDCFTSWDCVDWEGTINGITVKDLY